MQQYLSFLVNSIGIPKASKKPKKKAESSGLTQLDVTWVLSLRAAAAFIRCESFRARLQSVVVQAEAAIQITAEKRFFA
jgi:hypothetical protein